MASSFCALKVSLFLASSARLSLALGSSLTFFLDRRYNRLTSLAVLGLLAVALQARVRVSASPCHDRLAGSVVLGLSYSRAFRLAFARTRGN